MDYSNKTVVNQLTKSFVILICKGREIVDHTEGGMNKTAGCSVFIFGLFWIVWIVDAAVTIAVLSAS